MCCRPHALLLGGLVVASGCAFVGGGTSRGPRGQWPDAVPAVRNVSGREVMVLDDGAVVVFMRHKGPFEGVVADLVTDLVDGGWQVLDAKGSLYSRSIAGCGSSCEELRFYAVTRKLGPASETLLRVSAPTELRAPPQLTSPCEPVTLARDTLDEASRYGPIYDVDLDRDGRLDVYVPRAEGDRVVWDARVMRGACGHLVGTFERLPGDPHTTKLGEDALVDLTIAEEHIDEDGRRRGVPVTYHFDGQRYVRPEASPS